MESLAAKQPETTMGEIVAGAGDGTRTRDILLGKIWLHVSGLAEANLLPFFSAALCFQTTRGLRCRAAIVNRFVSSLS